MFILKLITSKQVFYYSKDDADKKTPWISLDINKATHYKTKRQADGVSKVWESNLKCYVDYLIKDGEHRSSRYAFPIEIMEKKFKTKVVAAQIVETENLDKLWRSSSNVNENY